MTSDAHLAVRVAGVRKTYGQVMAVDEVSFEVRQGEIFGLIGPNGAGKTTTLECVEGLRQPDRGTISVLGLDPVRGIRARGKTVFMTTHPMEEAERLCDRVAIIEHGRIIDVDAPSRLVARRRFYPVGLEFRCSASPWL